MAHTRRRSGRSSFLRIASFLIPSFCGATSSMRPSPISAIAAVTTLLSSSHLMSSFRLWHPRTAVPATLPSSSQTSTWPSQIALSRSSCLRTRAVIWITLRSTAVRTLIQFRTSFVSKSLHIMSVLLPHNAPNQTMERTADRCTLHFLR